MNNKILALIILILLFLLRKPKKNIAETEILPLVTSYKTPDGEVFFAIQLNDNWYQVNASKSEEREVITCKVVGQCKVYYLKSKPTPDGFSLIVIRGDGRDEEVKYFADKDGIII
jgi:hypothetical protein